MVRKKGFTLIELLVVIAIITLLAAIVVPRVSDWVNRSRMAKAVAEIQNAETSLVKMLADADKSRFQQFFVSFNATLNNLGAGLDVYEQTAARVNLSTEVLYRLLRQGRNIPQEDINQFGLDPEVIRRLGTSYMDLGLDPWGERYQFYIGPWEEQSPVLFRSYRPGVEDQALGTFDPYRYTLERKQQADARVPGNPPVDNQIGFPAPRDLTVYIFAKGLDTLVNQLYFTGPDVSNPRPQASEVRDTHFGGGDDVNNWDNERGWEPFYN